MTEISRAPMSENCSVRGMVPSYLADRIKARHRFLKYNSDIIALDITKPGPFHTEQFLSFEHDAALLFHVLTRQKACNGMSGHGFARARLSYYPDYLTRRNIDVKIIDNRFRDKGILYFNVKISNFKHLS